MHRSQSTETRGSKGMRPLNRRFAPPIRGWRPSERIRISNLCPLLFLDSELLGQAPVSGGELPASHSFIASMTALQAIQTFCNSLRFRREFPRLHLRNAVW